MATKPLTEPGDAWSERQVNTSGAERAGWGPWGAGGGGGCVGCLLRSQRHTGCMDVV